VTWFKIDDGFSDHRKVIALQQSKHWKGALALWTLAGSWCSRHLSDGFVPAPVVTRLGASPQEAGALVAVGLWTEAEGGYQFHGWDEHNPSREHVEAKRAAQRERVTRHREKRAGNASCNALQQNHESVSNAIVTPPPTRPDPDPIPIGVAAQHQQPPHSDFGRFEERFWRVFVEWFTRHRGGQHPSRTKHVHDVALAVWRQATDDGIDPEQYAHALCDLYWQQDWPRDLANRPSARNFFDQLDRLLPQLREDWADYIRPHAGAAE
jgi:hypothetical protein